MSLGCDKQTTWSCESQNGEAAVCVGPGSGVSINFLDAVENPQLAAAGSEYCGPYG